MRHIGPPLGANTTFAVTTTGHAGTVAIAAVGGGSSAAACHRAILLVNEGGMDETVQVDISGLSVPASCTNAGALTLNRFACVRPQLHATNAVCVCACVRD